jgi:uncharacterized protein
LIGLDYSSRKRPYHLSREAAHEIQTGFRTRRTDFRFDSGSGRRGFCGYQRLCHEQAISAASVAAIGAFESAKVGWFDLAARRYNPISVDEQCEVLSLIGDIAQGDDGKASLHLHAVLGLRDGTVRGGHFLGGKVRPTLEVTIIETASNLRRRKRADLGIALIDI